MDVTIEHLSPVEKRVVVELPWDTVRAKLDEAYKELAQHVSLKGFRKGHAPRPVLEKLFGRKLERELARVLVDETWEEAARKQGLHPVAKPVVEDDGIASGSPFRYRARVEVAPEIELREYAGLALARRAPRVLDEQVEAELERRRQGQADLRKIEGRPTRAGDVLLVDLMGKIGDRPVSAENALLELGAQAREPLPGLAAALTGLPAEPGEHEVQLTLAQDHPDEGLRGKAARLLVTIKDAREKQVPALDDEFAKDTGEAETLAGLREQTRSKLVEADRRRAEQELREQVVQALIAKNPFELTPALVEQRLDRVMAQARGYLRQTDGVDLDDQPEAMQKLRGDLRGSAEEQVRRALLLEAIARKEQVEVSEADVDKRLAEVAAAQGRGESVARLRAEMHKSGAIESLRAALREEKVLDLVLAKATITEDQGAAAP